MKSWIHSKTLWVNFLVFVGSLASGFSGDNWLDGEVQLIFLSLVDFFLRLVTTKGLEL
mgnify:CR=1 FL=1|jgi:hypothetical protein|tara:strand:- start:92 stop:265 length:174 start_codon:yes stop_codon:yes gene_type:complete